MEKSVVGRPQAAEKVNSRKAIESVAFHPAYCLLHTSYTSDKCEIDWDFSTALRVCACLCVISHDKTRSSIAEGNSLWSYFSKIEVCGISLDSTVASFPLCSSCILGVSAYGGPLWNRLELQHWRAHETLKDHKRRWCWNWRIPPMI